MAAVPAKCRVDLGRMRLLLRDSKATLAKGWFRRDVLVLRN
jgi:hypothetical protein